jgi:hypothetical protein
MLEFTRAKQQIDEVFKLGSSLPPESEILSHWAKYLCVLTSGLLEHSMRVMLSEYVEKRAHPTVARFAQQHLERITNLNGENLKQLLGRFSDRWRLDFDTALTDEQKDEIDSIVANRNAIAHGRQVGITMYRMRAYYQRVTEVLDWILSHCIGG